MPHHDGYRAILIVRLSAMGDIVMASPLIAALRDRYPSARLAWLVQPEFAALLHDHPGLDEVIPWPRAEWRRLWRERRIGALWREVRRFRRGLRKRGFDVVLDLQGLMKSALLARLSGAPRRVGLDPREGGRHLMTEVVDSAGRDAGLIGSEYRHLAGRLGLDGRDFRMHVGVGDEARTRAAELLDGAVDGRGFAAICPFTTRPQKHWPASHWVELAAALDRELGLAVVMLGGPGDRDAAAGIADRAPVVDLAGRTGLQEAAEIIRRAACLVGVDTGLTHVGTAFAIPTVALFGSTRPYLHTDSPRTHVVYHDLPCAPCRRRPTCGGAFTCLAGITPDEVMQVLRALLDRA